MKNLAGTLKKVGAVLLLVAFFLPLSRCEKTSTPPVEENAAIETIPVEVTEYSYYYAWDYIDIDDPRLTALVILAFLWPIIFIGLRHWNPNPKFDTGVLFLEPFAAAGGSYIVVGVGTMHELYIGSYLALLAAILFFSGSILEIVEFFKKRKAT